MFKRWLLALLARVGLVLLGLCCCLFLAYLLACKPTPDSGHQVAPWPGGREGYMALLQEKEDSHRHYVNSLTKQMGQLKEALLERTQRLQEGLEKGKAGGILPGGLESLTRSDLKVGKRHSGEAALGWGGANARPDVSPGAPPLPAEPRRGELGREAVQRIRSDSLRHLHPAEVS